MATTSNEPQSKMNDLELDSADDPAVAAGETLNADPITGEPGAHPAAVGVGALSAGAAGAAIGMIAGPIGAVIGAAIGAVAGGLAGHEVAATNSAAAAPSAGVLDPEATGSATDDDGRPSSVAPLPEDSLTVFPGSDFGSPAVMAEPVDPAAETATEGISFKDAAVTEATPGFTGTAVTGNDAAFTAASHGFTVGEDPEDAVRVAAYHRYLDRLEAGRPGDELGDWYEAEREVTRF